MRLPYQHHPPRLDEVARLEAEEIDARGNVPSPHVAGAPRDLVAAGGIRAAGQDVDLPPVHREDGQSHRFGLWQFEDNSRDGIERIRPVLPEPEDRRHRPVRRVVVRHSRGPGNGHRPVVEEIVQRVRLGREVSGEGTDNVVVRLYARRVPRENERVEVAIV